MSKTDASRVTHRNGALVVDRVLSLNASDAALVRELIQYAVESMRDVMQEEEKWASRGYRPIMATLESYIADAANLLARIS